MQQRLESLKQIHKIKKTFHLRLALKPKQYISQNETIVSHFINDSTDIRNQLWAKIISD
jgi:hypothetical protein